MTAAELQQKGNMEKPKRWPCLWLAIGMLLLALSNGSLAIPLATCRRLFSLCVSPARKSLFGDCPWLGCLPPTESLMETVHAEICEQATSRRTASAPVPAAVCQVGGAGQ